MMDAILPEPNAMPKSEERLIRVMETEMITNFGARERARPDWEASFVMGEISV